MSIIRLALLVVVFLIIGTFGFFAVANVKIPQQEVTKTVQLKPTPAEQVKPAEE
ncbi:MAG: hypothetical protein KDI13_05630 [Alphaproteobacteria bacterium]|nr:hypothetical protein [Alphaproteobacteria bacterium]